MPGGEGVSVTCYSTGDGRDQTGSVLLRRALVSWVVWRVLVSVRIVLAASTFVVAHPVGLVESAGIVGKLLGGYGTLGECW